MELLALDRVITINGTTYDFPALIDKGRHLVYKGLRNAFDQESVRCINMDDISQVKKMMTRIYQLGLLADDYQPPYDIQTKWKDFEECSRYQLIFKSAPRLENGRLHDHYSRLSGDSCPAPGWRGRNFSLLD